MDEKEQEKVYEGVYGFVLMPQGHMAPVEVVDCHGMIALVRNVAGYGNQFEIERNRLYLCEHFPGQLAHLIKHVKEQQTKLMENDQLLEAALRAAGTL